MKTYLVKYGVKKSSSRYIQVEAETPQRAQIVAESFVTHYIEEPFNVLRILELMPTTANGVRISDLQRLG